ncbi:MAG: beta strand repeat-containing protein, partial [Flavisolibacter sp.]
MLPRLRLPGTVLSGMASPLTYFLPILRRKKEIHYRDTKIPYIHDAQPLAASFLLVAAPFKNTKSLTANYFTMQPKLRLLGMTVAVLLMSFVTTIAFGQATVTSDKPDYAPRSNAVFTGSGFLPGETVALKVRNISHACNTIAPDSSYTPWSVVADASGGFVTNWTVCDCNGDSLKLRAVGQSSHDTAYVYFSDATGLSNLSIGSQVGALVYGTPSAVSYNCSIKATGNPSNETVTFSFSPALPTGVSVNSIIVTNNSTLNFTLTLTSSSNTPAITQSYTVTATSSSGASTSSLSNALSLVIGKAALTVLATDQTKQYGTTASTTGVPGTTLTITGLKNSDAISGATLSYNSNSAGITGNLANASVGSYVITPSAAMFSTGSASNYTITYSLGNLFVSKAPLTIKANDQSKCQGIPFTFNLSEFTSSGLQNNETIGTVILTSGGTAASATTGTYAIVPSSASGGSFKATNYNITYTNGSFVVNGNPAASILPNTAAATTICSGSSITLNGSASGGSGSGYTYNWNNTGFGSATALTLTDQTTSSNNSLVVKDDLGCVSSSVSQTVTINSISAGSIAKGATVQADPACGSINPPQTVSTTNGTGSGTITYTWEQSTDGGTNWVPAVGEGTPPVGSFNPINITTTTIYRRVATSSLNGSSCSATSNEIAYVVNSLPSVNAITGGTSVCENSTLQLSNTTPGGIWSSDDPSIVSISTAGLVTGVSVGTLSSGIHYTVTDANGCSKTANKTITVNALPTASISGSTTICSGSSANLSVDFTGAQPWSFTYNDGTNHTISGISSSTYTLTVNPTSATTYSLVSVNDDNCSNSASGSVTVNVNVAPSIGTQPSNITTTYGNGDVSFSVSASGTPVPTYQWQVNTGSGFIDVAEATSSTLIVSNPTVAMNGYLYRVVVTNSCSGLTSNEVRLTVGQKALQVTANNTSKTYGETVSFAGSEFT